MFKHIRVNWWVAGVLAAAAYALSTGSAQAEPPAYYSRTYVTTTQTVNYGAAYVPATTVTYVQPTVTYVQPAASYAAPVYAPVVYPSPVYAGGYCGPRYYPRPYYAPYAYRPYARPYYGGYGYARPYAHRSWGFGVAGGGHGGGFGFYYNK